MVQAEQHRADVALTGRCFQFDMTKAETTFRHGEQNNRACAVVLSPDPRVEVMRFNYSPPLKPTVSCFFWTWQFVIFVNYFPLLRFKLLAGFSYTSFTGQLQSHRVNCVDSSFGRLFRLFWAFFLLKISYLKLDPDFLVSSCGEDRPCAPKMQCFQKPCSEMDNNAVCVVMVGSVLNWQKKGNLRFEFNLINLNVNSTNCTH